MFHICFYIPRLKARFIGIYKFFSYVQDNLLKDVDEIGEIIGGLLNRTDVTSVESTDSGHGVRNMRETKKDMNANEQIEAVNLKAQMIKEIRDAGSKIFASKEPRQGSYSLFTTVNSSSKSDKEVFLFDNMPNLYPLWTYQFAHSVFVRLDGEKGQVMKAFSNFLEDKIPVLERSLGVEFGKWEVKNSIERQLKDCISMLVQKTCLPKSEKEVLKDLGEERTELSIEVFYIENPEWWKKAVQWGKQVVPIFENEVRELLRQYKVKEGEVIKVPLSIFWYWSIIEKLVFR